jgi:hypothetical protein
MLIPNNVAALPAERKSLRKRNCPMGLLLLEALLALVVLILIVWWTMFSGRPKGELRGVEEPGSDVADVDGSSKARKD